MRYESIEMIEAARAIHEATREIKGLQRL